jgi:fucose permease
MDLSLPLAPVAARNAVLVVTCAGGVLMTMIALAVYVYGHHASACIPLACVLAVQLALWLWLDRTYVYRS